MNLKHSEVSEMVFSDFVEQLIIYSKIICGMVKPWCLVLLVIDPMGIQTKKTGITIPGGNGPRSPPRVFWFQTAYQVTKFISAVTWVNSSRNRFSNP